MPLLTLQLRNIACRRGERVLFTGIDFDVAAGDLVWIAGANGSGKTTLLRMAAGLSQPAEGRILWGGEPASRSSAYRAVRRYVGHASGLKDDLTAMESLSLAASLQGQTTASPQLLARALDVLDLRRWAHATVRTLSQGQRRRLALAGLMLDDAPSLWLLDEPFDALDEEGCATLDRLLAAHRQHGGSALLTSHRTLPATLAARQLRLGPMPVPPPAGR